MSAWETFEGENFHGSEGSDHFAEKLLQNAKACHRLIWAHPNFAEKTFVGGFKTEKFMNVFSLESFALYGIRTMFTLDVQLNDS